MKKKYTKKDLVDFGNYLLSEERKNNIINETNLNKVTDADLANWKDREDKIFIKMLMRMDTTIGMPVPPINPNI